MGVLKVNAERAFQLMEQASERGQPYVLFDHHEDATTQRTPFPGALALDEDGVPEALSRLDVAASPLILVCSCHGRRSPKLAQAFVDAGHARVYSIDGGYYSMMTAAKRALG